MPLKRVFGRLNRICGLARDDEGQALVEYALLLALISIIAIGAVQAFGLGVSTLYQSILDAVP